MTPEQLVSVSEFSHQTALFCWSNAATLYGFEWAARAECYDLKKRANLVNIVGTPSYTIPGLNRMFAIHNQGHGDMIRGGRAKAEGVKAGVPDIMLPVVVDNWAGLFIELKRPNKKVIEDGKQADWLAFLNHQGYQAHECRGWEAARDCIIHYLSPIIERN